MDNDENRNAFYEKPRRIIQNQTLIQLFIILSIAVPIPLAGVMFWTVFYVYPYVVVPSVLTTWLIVSVGYTVMYLHARIQKHK